MENKEEYEGKQANAQSYRREGTHHTSHSSLRDFLVGHSVSHGLFKNSNPNGDSEARQMAQWLEYVPYEDWSLDPQNLCRASAEAHICNPNFPVVRWEAEPGLSETPRLRATRYSVK